LAESDGWQGFEAFSDSKGNYGIAGPVLQHSTYLGGTLIYQRQKAAPQPQSPPKRALIVMPFSVKPSI
jgi:hypothetical protein